MQVIFFSPDNGWEIYTWSIFIFVSLLSPYLETHAAFLASNVAVAMRYGQALAIEYLKIQFMNATYQHYDT